MSVFCADQHPRSHLHLAPLIHFSQRHLCSKTTPAEINSSIHTAPFHPSSQARSAAQYGASPAAVSQINDMDAQNAAGPDETRPAASASESKRPDRAPDETRSPAPPAPAKSPVDDSRPSAAPDKDVKPGSRWSVESADEKNADAANSDAETIVLPGKDGHSPSKVRKVKHEDKSEGENPSLPARASHHKEEREGEHAPQRGQEDVQDHGKDGVGKEKEKGKDRERSSTAAVTGPTDSALSQPVKKKRLLEKPSEKPSLPPPRHPNIKDPSVSTSTSPPPRSRPSADANPPTHSDSNSDTARHKPSKDPKDKSKGAEKLIPHKRKALKLDSDDEDENRKARRQRTAPASTNPDAHPAKQTGDHQNSDPKSHGHARSVSPPSRTHRHSVSTSNQPPSQSSTGLGQKKKRVPAPLQSTEYHSDDSSSGGSPHPRSSKLRNLSTPAMTESTASPAKVAPHKKHLDAHGQTFLARACARGEYDQAKQRLSERPEDLNVADYAGNTPLQIAAINGCEDIVELLINAGCNLECVNYDKDTPLLDAVDNGHLGVVKLLLDAGVNPRKANVHGEEPLDRVNDEFDNADEIRALLIKARQRMGDRRRTSEERNPDNRASTGPESPRRSPAAASNLNAQSTSSRRAGKTSNHLLYMPMDDKTLRTAAGRGDEETVTRILQVRDGCDDSEAMVNAARGGHDVVMQLLLALGGANPDPPPVPHMPAEVATPMLAAIGQENIKVIQLLLDQANFDPTRRFKGETYFEIARRRQGTNWKDEEHILSKAYEEHRKSRSKDLSKNKSPNRQREKEKDEREKKRASRTEGRDDAARPPKRNATSPTRDGEPKKKTSTKPSSSPKEKKRSHDDNQSSPKRGLSRPKNDDKLPTINVSDRENSPAVHKAKVKRSESDLAAVSSEGEAVKPRRKLVSKAELRGEQEKKQRRPSQVSSASSLKDPASPSDSRNDDHPEKHTEKEKLKGEKYRDRTKTVKRDESKDRLSVTGESAKRHRSSATPPHSNNGDKDDSEVPTKKRRLDAEGKERRPKEDRPTKPTMSREQSLAKSMKAAKLSQKTVREDDERRENKVKRSSDPHRREYAKSISSDKSILVKCEDPDVDMRDAPPAQQRGEAESKPKQLQEDQEKKRAAEKAEDDAKEEQRQRELEEKEREKKRREEEEEARRAEEVRRKEEEKKRRKEEEEKKRRAEEEKEKKRKEEEERKRKEDEERKRKEEEERKRKEEEERKRKEEAEEQRRKEEEERKRREEEERVRREEEARKQREEAERKRKEEEERLRKEEEERKQREAEEKRKREEEEKRKREEEERLRREQAEREAAEAARRKREEEERREREHRERQRAREAEIRRQREEQERIRLAKLPALLRWLETCPNPKTTQLAEKFTHMQGVRYDTIRPDANGTADGREQWVLNTQVALLLGEKDLSLSRCTFSPVLPFCLTCANSV